LELFESRDEGSPSPLAKRMAPRSLDEYAGQKHLLGKGKPLRRLIEDETLFSCVFFGPPGTGKTSLGKIIAERTHVPFVYLSAPEARTGELKKIIALTRKFRQSNGKRAVLFLDEVHRFNRQQQEFLLPAVERGDFIFIGSTVENPFFALSKALLSRCLVFEFRPLSEDDLLWILKAALADLARGLGERGLEAEDTVLKTLCRLSDGDARRALNALEFASATMPEDSGGRLTDEALQTIFGRRVLRYSRNGDEHYDIISALIKSIRGSDPDAAEYWLVRLLESGEDPLYVLRRLLVHSAEDIGLADPNALVVIASALQGFERVGRPEGDLLLSEAVLYLATAPKSNTVLRTLSAARKALRENEAYEVPSHLRSSGYSGAKELDRGVGYVYPHGRNGPVDQTYLPEKLLGLKLFSPSPIGFEKDLIRRAEEREEV
jgi:putative ATPase